MAQERDREQGGPWGVGALAFLLVASAAWWALALWPVPGETPAWLARTRWVCFNAGPDGLPDTSGWLLLVGQPLGMLAALMAGWGGSVRAGLRALAGAASGRALLAASALLVVVGLGAAGVRVASATARPALAARTVPLPDTYPRLDRAAPALGLVDQHGQVLELSRLEGRPALVTFAFGHCETVCPLIVREALEAQRKTVGPAPRVVVVTLDPWRDTPSRLPHLARHWGAGEDTHLLSGSVDQVERVLDAWGVARRRHPDTGDIAHPPLVYVLDASGRIAYAASGGVSALVELLARS